MIVCIAFVVMAENAISVKQLAIKNNELSGWIPRDTMRIFRGAELYDYMDGAVPQYFEKGVITTGAQILDGQNSTRVKSMIMDFGRDSNAVAMFLEKKAQNTGRIIGDPIFPDSVAFMHLILGGIQGYGHYSNYYFEIAADGFSDTAQAIPVFDTMLTWYIQKINELQSVAIKNLLTASNKRGSLKHVEFNVPDFFGKQTRQGNLLNGRTVSASRKTAAISVIERIRSQNKK